MATTKGKFAWHVHHQTLTEKLFDPISVRRDYIRRSKPIAERKLRLRLLKVVKDQKQVSALYQRAFEARTFRAREEVRRELLKLHKDECENCPWKPYSATSMYGGTILTRYDYKNGEWK